MLQPVQELRRPVGVRAHDHLLGRVVVSVLGAAGQARVAGLDLEAAAVERCHLVHLVQLVHLGPVLLGEVEVFGRRFLTR